MRPLLLAVLAATLLAPAAANAAQPLRLNDLQARGTHNSFHRDPGFPGREAAGWDYSHAPLDAQFEDGGVRQIELDVHWNTAREEFEVYHAWLGDDRTTCDELTDCLATVKSWSDAHPDHHPVLVMVEFKDAGLPHRRNGDLPENGDPFAGVIGPEQYEELDRTLLAGLGPERTLTPDDVTVPGRTLRDSILSKGWPRLDDVRGQVLFLVDGDSHARDYSGGWSSLERRTLFVQAEPDQPVAAFIGRDGARGPGEGKYDRMRRLTQQGFMVRDYVSPDGFDAAKAGGAHFISSDDPDQLRLSGDPAAPSRCNPITAPANCADTAVERHDSGDGHYTASTHPGDGLDQVAKEKAERLGCGNARNIAAIATGSDPGCPGGSRRSPGSRKCGSRPKRTTRCAPQRSSRTRKAAARR